MCLEEWDLGRLGLFNSKASDITHAMNPRLLLK